MSPSILHEKVTHGHTLEQHVATGNPQQQERWRAVIAKASLSNEQKALVQTFTRQLNILIVSGVWCGDCIEQLPLIQAIVDANPSRLALRVIDRDQHADLSAELKINGGARVPVVLFLSEDYEFCGLYGDRPLSRYRAIAAKKIGAACSLGAVVPPNDELAATTADWLNEVERIHLMLRLSPRLRERHGD